MKLALAASLCALAGAGGLACRRSVSRITVDARPSESSPAGEAVPPGSASIPPQGAFSFTRAEARSVEVFLAKNPDLRLAGDTDARASDDSADVARLYGVYHPYFVRGDVNDDGALDFVAAFVDRKRTGGPSWFTVVVFCSDRSGSFRDPQVLEREVSLERGDVSIDRDSILITPDLGEDANRRYRWNGLRRHFEFVSDEDGISEPRPTNRL